MGQTEQAILRRYLGHLAVENGLLQCFLTLYRSIKNYSLVSAWGYCVFVQRQVVLHWVVSTQRALLLSHSYCWSYLSTLSLSLIKTINNDDDVIPPLYSRREEVCPSPDVQKSQVVICHFWLVAILKTLGLIWAHHRANPEPAEAEMESDNWN